jgi:DNA-binding IclR family transcriptional regulator
VALAEVREAGYAVNPGYSDPDLYSIAVPVRDYTTAVVAGICVTARRSTITDERRTTIVEEALASAADLSRALSYSPKSASNGNEA